MYHDNFGLNQPPFRNTPDTRVFYKGGKRGAILEALEYAILQGEGIIKVVGEVGSGKTMLCRMLESRLGKKVETVFIANPSLTPENIFHAIAVELHIDVAEKNDKFQVLHSLQNDLIQKHAAGRRVVVLVEEAQGMPLATLEEIRLLSNLETSSSKLLQLVLFGQPELDVNLSVPSIRQLRERISYQFHLPPFTQEDVEEYLIMRMRSAGYRGPTPFQPGACRRICKLSGGLTRRINLLADKALLAAYIEKKDRVSTRHVNQAAAESSFTAVRDWRRTTRIATLVALIGVPLAGGLGFYLAGVNQTQPTLISPSTTPPEKPDEVTQIQVKPQPTPETQTTLEQPPAPKQAGEEIITFPAPTTPNLSPAPTATELSGQQRPVPNDKPSPPEQSPQPPHATPAQQPTTDLPSVKPLPANRTDPIHPPSAPVTSSTETIADKDTAPPPKGEMNHTLSQKLAASNQWFKTADPSHYTLQIMVVTNKIDAWIQEMANAEAHMGGKFFIKPTTAGNQTNYIVFYNDYASFSNARADIERLPQKLRQFTPFVQSIKRVLEKR